VSKYWTIKKLNIFGAGGGLLWEICGDGLNYNVNMIFLY